MRRRGVTLIELLVALLLLGVSLAGLAALWSFGFNVTGDSQDMAAAYSVARQEIERAKNMSYFFLPEATWTTSYDDLGNPTSEANPHFVATVTVHTIPDANGELNTGCLREVSVAVTARDQASAMFETLTYLTRGGV
ncbi:MAG: prepilin-type N-terminal cleavage/methylation domain-containing protein [Armatimonadota bacterium]